jgi:Zn-dependent protease/CBS domain-containing protein
MGDGLKIGRIAGVDVHLDWSLLIIFSLIVVSLGSAVFPAWHPDWSSAMHWSTALAAATLFFVSVLLHELSHAVVGRRQGMAIPRITLFVFGGMAHLEDEPREWKAELWMAIVGPITSFIIGVACTTAAVFLAGPANFEPGRIAETLAGLGALPTLLLWLGQINLVLAVFNLVPGFPLDGGRVLRAVLWGATGNLQRATRWASGAGRTFAWILIGSGFAMMLGLRVPVFGTGLVAGLWIALIGWFLNNAALAAYHQLLVRESLDKVPVRRLMQSRFQSASPDLPVDQFVEEYLLHTDQRGFPVLQGDRLAGMVCLEDVRKLDRREWPARSVRDVMTPVQALVQISPNEDSFKALTLLGERGINQMPVVESGQVLGLIRREDIIRWLSLHGEGDARHPDLAPTQRSA